MNRRSGRTWIGGAASAAGRAGLLLAVPLFLSCPLAETSAYPPGPEDPVANLAQLDAFADRVQTEALTAAWRAATEPAPTPKPKPYGIKPLLLLTDAEVSGLGERLDDPRQTQCLQAVHSFAVRMQSESDFRVSRALTAIADLREQRAEDDLAPVAQELAPLLRQLVSARNRWARQRSRLPYLELMKVHRGYAPQVAEGLEKEVRRALPDDVPKVVRGDVDLLARRFDEAHCLERASSVFVILGLPANPPALQIREATRTAFSPYAFYGIDPPAVQGVTVRPGAGAVPHQSVMHELGHAAMSLLAVPSSCRTMRRPVSAAVSEGCARIAERLFHSEEWLRSQDVPVAEIEALQKWERERDVARMRGILADLELERALYRDPDGEAFQAGGDLAWALKRDLVFEPLARMDYLLARCAQAAVYRRLRQLPGGLLGGPARRLLRDQVFSGATAMQFEEWFRRAAVTGPSCDAWLQDVAAAHHLR